MENTDYTEKTSQIKYLVACYNMTVKPVLLPKIFFNKARFSSSSLADFDTDFETFSLCLIFISYV